MDSDSELLTSEVETSRIKPRNKKLNKLKNNRVASPDIQSVTPSETSIEMDVFIARNPRNQVKKTQKLISDDDLSTARTSDDLDTEISEDQSLQSSDKLAKSYRDKLKERFLSVKQLSSQNLEKNLLKKFKSRSRNIENLNKCIDNLRNDNHSVDMQLKAHKTYVYQGVGEVSSAEKYQFFCESSGVVDEDAKTNELTDERVVDVKRAENFKALLAKSYEECIWLPKKHNLTHENESTNENEEENEITQPKIPQRHLKLLNQRLLASENSDFFNASGEIKFEKTNYSGETYRPLNFDTENPYKLTYNRPTKSIKQSLNKDISSVHVQETQPTLEINLQGIRFTQHPLFSAEHVLQEELIRLIDTHKTFKRSQKRENLSENLQKLRERKIEHSNNQHASGDHKMEDTGQLIKEIKQIREDLYNECILYRENVKSVLETWKNLKQLRSDVGYSRTTIKLIIERQPQRFWDNPEEVLEEIRVEDEAEYQEKLDSYKEKLQRWKDQEDQEDEEKPIKPPRIQSYKKRKVREKIDENIREVFGDHNEPSISFSVDYSNEIETNTIEETTRKSVEMTNIFLRLTLGKLHICKTKVHKLTSNFTLHIDEILSIQLTNPESDEKIGLELVQVRLKNIILCKTEISIPKMDAIHGQTNFQEVFFTSKSVQPQSSRQSNKNLMIKGFLTFCIGWNWNSNKKCVSSPIDGVSGGIDTCALDDGSALSEYLQQRRIEVRNVSSRNEFRFDPYLESFTISSKDEIVSNVRLKLLELRDRNEPEFVGMIVPLRIKEIPSNVFTTYNRRLAEEKYQEYFDTEVDDDIIGSRSLGRKYLRQMQVKVFQICRNCENNLSFDDVIDEKMVPWIQNYLKTILKNCLNWFKFQPALNIPLPLLQMQTELAETGGGHNTTVKVVIQLKSGINLATTTAINGNAEYFIEISCGKTRRKSGLSQGKCATWNESISLSMESLNVDYLNPQSLSGSILIRLFQLRENGHEEIDISSELTHFSNYLGCIEIPVAAALSDIKLEGEFPLKTPEFIYGYEKEEERQVSTTPRIHTTKNLSFLDMSVYSESTIPKIQADMSSITSSEPPFIRDHVLEWNKRFNADHPKRKFNALAIDSNGKSVCLTRYIRTLEAPKLNTDEFDVSLEQCARFVSLIPFSKANKFYENVWMSGEQLLKLGIGTVQDHATLLTCYLLSLKMDVWLLLGFGIPHGNTAYVLLREYNDTPLPYHFIIDVTTGVKYNITDQYCPLKKIYCVVNENNIWANMQRGDAVFTTRFDFTRRFDWRALFNETISAPSNAQQKTLHYMQSGNAIKLQNAIERKLVKRIMKVRDQDVTIWSHYFNKLLKEQITKAERNFMHGKTYLTASNQILEYSKNFQINGTIQCVEFSSVNDVVERVLQTDVWRVSQENEEFACCVQVHAYVNQVIAVWVAFVSIVKSYE